MPTYHAVLSDVDVEVPPYFAPITPLQARRALRAAGLLDQVEALLTTQTDPDATDAYHYAPMWSRDDLWITRLAPALNIDSAALDKLFTLAATL